MNLAFVTTAADEFGGVFARSYRDAGGPVPDLIVVLPPRPELGFHGIWRLVAVWKLLGIFGAARMLAARKLRRGLTREDRQAGLALDWISTLAGSSTRVVERSTINDRETAFLLSEFAPDVLVSVGAPIVFQPHVLKVPKLGTLNVHNGRLPLYRGHFGTFWEVRNHETESFMSIHVMTNAVDAGPILAAEPTSIALARSFLDLMIMKKENGGRALAAVLKHATQAGILPKAITQPSGPSRHFRWPSSRDLLSFSWRKSRRAGGGSNDAYRFEPEPRARG